MRKQTLLILTTLFFALALSGAVFAEDTTDNATNHSSNIVISGSVEHCSDGEPFPGVTVSVKGNGEQIVSTTTQSDGSYTVTLPFTASLLQVTASSPGHNPVTNELQFTENSPSAVLNFILGMDEVWISDSTGDDDIGLGTEASPYKTLRKGIKETNSGGTLHVLDGTYTGPKNRNLEIKKSISIIGQSQVNTIINAKGLDWIFDVYGPGFNVLFSKLTLKNAYIDYDGGAAIFSNEGSTVTVSECSFIDNYVGHGLLNYYNGGAIYNEDGNLIVTDCLFNGNYASRHGGAIYSKNGDVTVTDSIFKNNKARKDGGAIYNKKGNLTVTGSKFKKNKGRDGGAIYHENGALTVTDSLFKKNKARNVGGAIFNEGDATITDSTFNGNIAADILLGGSAIFNMGTMTITGSKFKNNDATASDGGAIFNFGGITITETIFTNNAGGAIVNWLGDVSLTESTFTENTADFNGAGIYNFLGDVTVTNSTFTGNSANEDAGAIYNLSGDLTVTGSVFDANLAAGNAGAILNWGVTVIEDCIFKNNIATYAGAIYNREGTLTVTGCHITDNHAYQDGGAFYWWPNYSTSTVNFNRIVGNTADNSGDAIYSAGSGSANAEYNWWGLNNPNFTNLISGPSTVDYTPWLFMTLTANPTTINNRETSQITVNFNNYSSDGTTYTPLSEPLAGHIPDLTPVNFQTDLGSVGSKTIDKFTVDGIATATLKADELAGTAHLTATTDLETLNTDVVINPKSSVYLTITPGKTNPVVGDTVVYTLKVGNRGPDAAENVVMTYKIPEGLEFVGARDDIGNKWTYDPATRTLTWNLGTVPVGDPYLWLSLRIVRAGNYLLNPVLTTTTYDPTLNSDTQSLTIHAAISTQINAHTIGMQKTGLPLLPLILASLMLVGGLMAPRRIK